MGSTRKLEAEAGERIKKGLLADTTPKYHPHNISCHHSFIPSSREGDFSVATGVGKATEVRARMLEVYKPNNNNLNNDSLESPPLPTILVYIFQPIQGIPWISTNNSPHQKGRLWESSAFKKERSKTLTVQFLPERSKTLCVQTPPEG